jgi:type III pantothenate kinase
MLLTIDIGNTCVGVAIFSAERILAKNKLITPDRITVRFLKNLVGEPHLAGIDSIIISSVVPYLDQSLSIAVESLFGKKAVFIDHHTPTGIEIKVDTPRELGADRIANSAGGIHFSTPPLIIIDSGTATTFDIVNEKYEYIGGCIMPGIELSIRSLASNTAKLDRISFAIPESILGTDTESNIQAGIYYSCIGGLEFMIDEYKKITGPGTTVIATGGVSFYFKDRLKNIDIYEPSLVYYGLKYIHEKQNSKK